MRRYKNGGILAALLAISLFAGGCGAQPQSGNEDVPAVPAKENVLVFMQGANFTNMRAILTENNEDGTYRYEDQTEDGMTIIVNTAFSNGMTEDEDAATYLSRSIVEQGDGSEQQIVLAESEALSQKIGLLAYQMEWSSGSNEDTCGYLGVAALSEEFTYLYFFQTSADNLEDMRETYTDILSGLELQVRPRTSRALVDGSEEFNQDRKTRRRLQSL